MNTAAFLAHSGIWCCNDNVLTKVKLATLLYDRVIHSDSMGVHAFAQSTAEVWKEPQPTPKTLKAIDTAWCMPGDDKKSFLSWWKNPKRFQINDKSASPILKKAARSALLEFNYNPESDYESYKLLLYTISEIQYWRFNIPFSTFIGHDISDATLRSIAAPIIEHDGVNECFSACPDVLQLNWNDIFELRRSPYLSSFRDKYRVLMREGKTKHLMDHYQAAMEHIIKEARPNPTRSLLMAVLSNLPIPVIKLNPFHIAHNMHEVYHNWSLNKRYGWAFFMQEAREKINPSTQHA